MNAPQTTEQTLGRYAIFGELASGGMASVHLGRMLGPVGFSKTVAIKRMHPHLSRDPEFVTMFLDEARLAARIQHPNVVPTLDVVTAGGALFLVMEYVQGETLRHLLKAARNKNLHVSPRIAGAILVNALHGLHAAHIARDERGQALEVVHRDVSPQNIMVGVDGVARVLDFGVAKAAGRLQNTQGGQLKGKLAYMAPEQVRGGLVDRRTDVYAATIVLWEALTGRPLLRGESEVEVLAMAMAAEFSPPSSVAPGLTPEIDAVVMRGLARNSSDRFQTARDFAIAIERATGVASPFEVAEWVELVGAEALALRALRVREMESTTSLRALSDVSLTSDGREPNPDTSSHSDVLRGGGSGMRAGPAPHGYGSGMTGSAAYAGPVPDPPPSSTSRSAVPVLFAIAMLFAVGALGVVGALIMVRRALPPAAIANPQEPPAMASTATAPIATVPPYTPPATPIATATIPTTTAAPLVPTLPTMATATAAPIPVATAVPTAITTSAAAATATTRPVPPAPAPKKNCDSPVFVDKDGIKHIKPECM